MESKRDLAIVLRSVPYEERHRVVTALTENHGRVSALARNSIQSRRFGGTLDLFAASEWRFQERSGSDLWSLEGAEIKRSYEGLRADVERLAFGGTFSEIMLRIAPERSSAPDLFKLHTNALAALEELPDDQLMLGGLRLLSAYLAKTLQWGGAQPQLLSCLSCSKKLEDFEDERELSCLVADAGWVCCESRRDANAFQNLFRKATVRSIGDFLVAMTQPVRRAPQELRGSIEEHRALFELLEALVIYHVPGFDKNPIKSLKLLGLRSALA